MIPNSINGFAMTETYDFYTEVGDDGNFDIVPACNHEVVSNLIRTRLLTEVDWNGIMRNPDITIDIKRQLVRRVISQTFGVSDVDMAGFLLTEVDNQIQFGVICPTIDCANSKVCVQIQ